MRRGARLAAGPAVPDSQPAPAADRVEAATAAGATAEAMPMTDHHAAGRDACHALHRSAHYAWLPRPIPADIAARYCLPPVVESDIQMRQPLPRARREWLEGYEAAMREHTATDAPGR